MNITIYSDVNLLAGRSKLVENRSNLVVDKDSIKQSLALIYTTPIGSRVMRRDFGSSLEDLLWRPMVEETVIKIKTELLSAAKKWEPRIVITTTDCVPNYENQTYFCLVAYKIPALDEADNFTFNLVRYRN